MARLNLEPKTWSSYKFQKLLIMIGDRHRAMGIVVDLWALAQAHWFPKRELIPFDEFERAGLPEALIECGLAERTPNGIYAKGAEDQFAWLFQAQEAGKRSGQARSKNPLNGGSTAVNGGSTVVEGHSTSLLSTPTPTLKNIAPSKNELLFIPAERTRFNFLEIYKKYPRKEGKQVGINRAKREIKTPADFQALSKAVDRYLEHAKQNATEKRFLKMFSTFIGEWRDWLEPDAGAGQDFSKAKDKLDYDKICGVSNAAN